MLAMKGGSASLLVPPTLLPVRTSGTPHLAGHNRTCKCWVTSAFGAWVATVLHSDSRVAGGIEMKLLFISFIVGLGVGVLYGLIRVKSPAPPIVALLGLLGMVLGEQLGTWVHTRNVNVSQAASACLVGQRYDRPLQIQECDPQIQIAS